MNKKLIKSVATVGSWTFVSRIFGFARDMMMSRIIGAGPIADAFNAAFLLPNLFRRFLAEGAFNLAFVPRYKGKVIDGEDATRFAQESFSALFLILSILIALVLIFTPLAVMAVAWGYQGDERFDMTVHFTKITFFYIGFMSLSALCAGVLNSHGKFSAASIAPIFLNVVMIIMLLFIKANGISGEQIGFYLSIGVFLGGVVQFGLLYFGCLRLGIRLKLTKPVWNDDMRHLLMVAIPAVLAGGVAQINLVVGRQFASQIDGAVSRLNYADRLYQLPIGLIGVAIGVVLLPTLTSLIRKNDLRRAKKRFNEALTFSMFIALPCSIALFVLAKPIVATIFEGGKFGQDDVTLTAQALAIYAIALPAMILQKSQLQLFYAREDTKSPLRYSLIDVVLNVGVTYALWDSWGFFAPIFGSVVSNWAMSAFLYFGARKFGDSVEVTGDTLKSIGIYLVVSLVMGLMDFALMNQFAPYFTGWFRWLILSIIIMLSMMIYIGGVMVLTRTGPKQLLAKYMS